MRLLIASALAIALHGSVARDAFSKPLASTPLSAAERQTKTAAARTLLDGWLAAQNEGNFDAYMAFYAPTFRGVRRSGGQTVAMDLAGWRRDRGRMFARKMIVQANEVQVSAGARETHIRFIQRWSSGSYSDVGPKLIVVCEQPDGKLRIVSEAMLASRLLDEPRWPEDAATGRFAFVHNGRVFLAEGGRLCPRPRAAESESEDIEGEPYMGVSVQRQICDVSADAIPKPLAAWLREPVRLTGAAGFSCVARVTRFEAQRRREDSSYEEPEQKAVALTRAPFILVGVLEGECQLKKARWARWASLPPVTVAGPEPMPADLDRAARKALRTLDEWQAAQAMYEKDYADEAAGKPYWDHDHAAMRYFSATTPRGPRQLVSVAAWGQCGAFPVKLAALYEVTSGKLTLVGRGDDFMVLEHAVDVDGDGKLELVGDDSGTETGELRWILLENKGPNRFARRSAQLVRVQAPNPC